MYELPLLEKSCKQLLSAFSVQAELRSYRRDFAELWGMVENPRTAEVNKTWIIVLDGWPDAQAHPLVDARRYLGPRDWAVAWSLRLIEAGCDLSAFKLVLLEPGAFDDRHSEGYAYVAQFPGQRLPALPWLAVFGCCGVKGGRPLDELTDFLCRPVPPVAADSRVLRQYWRSLVSVPTQPGTHHAISNLVAPLVLLGDLQGDVYTEALKVLLRALGLLPQHADRPSSWLDDELRRKIVDVIPKKQSLRLVLIDDHLWQQGWAEVLCRSLGIENFDGEVKTTEGKAVLLGNTSVEGRHLEVYGADSPTCLPFIQSTITCTDDFNTPRLEPLEQFNLERSSLYRNAVIPAGSGYPVPGMASATHPCSLDSGNPCRNDVSEKHLCITTSAERGNDEEKATFKLNLTAADKEACQEILLLDLRLFPNDHRREGDLFGKLADHAKRFTKMSLPWPGFSDQEIRDVENVAECLKKGDSCALETPHYHTALTFLPRLLALADCSLPIILFSSTGRREIVDKLADYGNIISRFDKPRFFGPNNDEIAEETAAKFRAALNEALDWVQVRVLGQNLLRHPAEVRAKRFDQESSTNNRYTAELYIDESGSEKAETMTVGGLLTVCPPGIDTKKLEQFLVGSYGKQILGANGKDFCRQEKNQIFSNLLKEAKECDIALAGVSVKGATNETKALFNRPGASPFDQEMQLDNLHRELTRNLCEAAFYHLARRWLPDNAYLDYKVYTATRIIHMGDKQEAQQAKDQWGVNFKLIEEGKYTGKYRLYLSTEGTARALVERVFQSYSHTHFDARPTHACGYGINDHTNSNNAPILHYLADALIDGINSNAFKDNVNKATDLAELWNDGFISQYERGLKALLYAQRSLLKKGDYLADALRVSALNEVNGVSFKTYDIRASMKAELQALLPDIQGSVLSDLIGRLKTPLPDELLPSPVKLSNDSLPNMVNAVPHEDALVSDKSGATTIEPMPSNRNNADSLLYGQLFSKSFSLQVKGDDGLIYKGRCTCQGGFTVAPGDRVRFSLADIDGCRMIDFIAKEQG